MLGLPQAAISEMLPAPALEITRFDKRYADAI